MYAYVHHKDTWLACQRRMRTQYWLISIVCPRANIKQWWRRTVRSKTQFVELWCNCVSNCTHVWMQTRINLKNPSQKCLGKMSYRTAVSFFSSGRVYLSNQVHSCSAGYVTVNEAQTIRGSCKWIHETCCCFIKPHKTEYFQNINRRNFAMHHDRWYLHAHVNVHILRLFITSQGDRMSVQFGVLSALQCFQGS